MGAAAWLGCGPSGYMSLPGIGSHIVEGNFAEGIHSWGCLGDHRHTVQELCGWADVTAMGRLIS